MTTDTGTGTDAGAGLGIGSGPRAGDDGGAKERAQQAASSAADESKRVAGVAAEEAKNVASEATAHARNLVSEARGQLQGQVDDQSRQQKDLLATTLGTFGDDLATMAENGSGLAADVAHEVAERARSLSRHLDGREPRELLDDVRRFARQRPATFLLGALAAGVVVGRLARGTKDAVEAAEGADVKPDGQDAPRVTPGAPDTTSVRAIHAQPTIDAGSPGSPASGPQGGPTA
jgi:hypothetical protein